MANFTWATVKLGDSLLLAQHLRNLGEPRIANKVVNKVVPFLSSENHIQIPKVTLPCECFINMCVCVCTF